MGENGSRQPYFDRRTTITDGAVCSRSKRKTDRPARRDEHDLEDAFGEHAGERALALVHDECAPGVIPAQWDADKPPTVL